MKFRTLVLTSVLLSATAVWAKVDVGPLFIHLSDAMAEMKKGELAKSQQNLTALQQEFLNLEQNDSIIGTQVANALEVAIHNPNTESLEQLAKKLYAFEKEQNPVGYANKQKEVLEKMTPLYVELHLATQTKDIENIKKSARHFGKIWAKYEKAVREISPTYYGKFERTLGLMRIAVTAEKPDMAKVEKQVSDLGVVMAEFNQIKLE